MVYRTVTFRNILHEPFIEFSSVLHVTQQLLKVFLDTNPTLSDEAAKAIKHFASDESKKRKNSEQLAALKAVSQALQNLSGTLIGQHRVVMAFLEFATGSPFELRCLFEDNPKK